MPSTAERALSTSGGHSRLRRSDRLLGLLAGCERVLIVTHDTPDPDSIASGWVLWLLVRERLGRPVRFVGRGAILRAENRYLVELFQPPLEMIHDLDVEPGLGAVLVDCSPHSSNHLLVDKGVAPVAVIDHHEESGRRRRLPYEDIRPRVVASASIVTTYLREQAVEPGPALATALLYAIRTEAKGAAVAYSRLDRSATLWLSERADFSVLSDIEDAPLTSAYFNDLVSAMQNTLLFGRTGFCLLPHASNPEIVGEVADLLIRGETIDRVMCGAVSGDDLCVSVRTTNHGGDATQLVRSALAGLGHGGGHQHRAGGKIRNAGLNPVGVLHLRGELLNRWLAACDAESQDGRPLIAG